MQYSQAELRIEEQYGRNETEFNLLLKKQMADTPIKPLSEIEVKEEVSENDKILILDSETEEARLASKEELR